MNTTILNYPGFQSLPKGIKQMLLVSESHFFDMPAPHQEQQKVVPLEMRTHDGFKIALASLFRPPGVAFQGAGRYY